MPLNGSGSYSAPASSWNPAVTNTTINSTDWAALLADISTALSTALYRDGQQVPTANLPMGGFKLTGLGAGNATGNSLRYEQLFGTTVLTDQATVVWNTALTALATLTITASRTMAAPTGMTPGGRYSLLVTQDGTGGWSLTWNAVFKGMGGGTMSQPNTTAASVTLFSFISDGTFLYEIAQTPFIDSNYFVRGSADPTKKVRFEVDGLTTNVTRVITVPDADGTLAFSDPGVNGGRLTLTSGTAVTTSDVTAATTVYFTPYKSDKIATYNGSVWTTSSFTEKSVAVPSTTGTPFDIFIVDGTLALETVNWTNDTARATAITLQNGVYVKSGTTTRRYLGTGRTTGSSGQTEDSLAKRFLWNYSNRVLRPMKVVDGTNTWTYSTAAYQQANASTSNQLDYIQGVAEDQVSAHVIGACAQTSSAAYREVHVAIGVDSTTVSSGITGGANVNNALAWGVSTAGSYRGFPGIGRHFLAWLEYASGAGDTVTWYGDNGGTVFQTGIVGEFLA